MSQALITVIILLACLKDQHPSVCVSVYVTVTSFTVFKNRTSIFLPADVFLAVGRCRARMCAVRRNLKVMFYVLQQNISNT